MHQKHRNRGRRHEGASHPAGSQTALETMNRNCLACRDKLREKSRNSCRRVNGHNMALQRAGGSPFAGWDITPNMGFTVEDFFLSRGSIVRQTRREDVKGPEQSWVVRFKDAGSWANPDRTGYVECKLSKPTRCSSRFWAFHYRVQCDHVLWLASAKVSCVNQGPPLQGRND